MKEVAKSSDIVPIVDMAIPIVVNEWTPINLLMIQAWF